MNSFIFTDQIDEFLRSEYLIVEIDDVQSNKAQLIRALSDSIGFPEYFSGNWDSFEECLNDLSWIETKGIALIHRSLPLSENRRDFEIYLDILRNASSQWDSAEEHDLLIIFPKKFEEDLRFHDQ
jgi:RNAse (barnase) inhibitor barstar